MITSVRIESFKSVVDQTLELGQVNCLIGANGVGKSNLLEAIGVLGAAAGGRVDDEAIIRRGVRAGLPRLYKASFAGARIPPHITLSAQSRPEASYQVSLLNPLERPEPAWSFKTETLRENRNTLVSRGVRSEKKNLEPTAGLAALQVVELVEDDAAAQLLKALRDFAIYCPNTPTLRATQPDQQPRLPVGLAGGGLAEGFESLRKFLPGEVFDEVLDLVDWVSDISASEAAGALLAPSVARSKQVLRFTDRFMASSRNALTAYDASEGALYVLFAAVLCLAPASPRFFAIDNLDQALNPRLVARLVGRLAPWLQRAEGRQLLFTAHNPAVLDGLDLEDDAVRLFAVESWLGVVEPGPRTVFCVPSKATESWLAAAVLPADHKLLGGLECRLDLSSSLKVLPTSLRIRKTRPEFQARSKKLVAEWSRVRSLCTQADRFSREIAAALG